VKFFFDNNISIRLARAIGALCEADDVLVQHLKEKFLEDISDIDFINALAKEGDWVIISQDRLIKNPLEKEALRRSGLTAFILRKNWGNHEHWIKAAQLVRWWPIITSIAQHLTGGAVFEVPWRVSGKGKVVQIKL